MTRSIGVVIAGVVWGLVLAGAAKAEPAPPEAAAQSTVAPVVTITGHPQPPKDLPQAVSNFVETHVGPVRFDHLSRWRTPICPITVGLPGAYDTFITARIRSVAASVRAKVDANPKCTPNVQVIFSPEPQKLLDEIAAKHSDLLGYHYLSETHRLAMVHHTIQAWYVTATANGRMEIVDNPYNPTVSGAAGSRLGDGLHSVFVLVTIVVDGDKVVDRTIGPVSDYIAFLALTNVKALEDCSEVPTIMNIMIEGCAHADQITSLTDFDLAYLRALYTTDPGGFTSFQRSSMSRLILEDMKQTAKH